MRFKIKTGAGKFTAPVHAVYCYCTVMVTEIGQNNVLPTRSDQFDVYVPVKAGAVMSMLIVVELPGETSE